MLSTGNIVFAVGAFDAVTIAGIGVLGAALTVAGQDSIKFWDRIVPAAALLVGTSFAAGVVMAITRWLGG